MKPRLAFAVALSVSLVACASEEPSPATKAPPPTTRPSAPEPTPAPQGIVIKGSKSTATTSQDDRSSEDQERIARLQAAANASQGKHESGDPVAFQAVPKVKSKASRTPGSADWGDSLDAAIDRARAENKLVLADFTGSDWCVWCRRLKAEVLDTPEFKDWAAQNVVLLEVDFPHEKAQGDDLKAQNQKLKTKYGIKGFPTVVFFDPAGKEYGQLGYQEGGPAPWTSAAQNFVNAYHP